MRALWPQIVSVSCHACKGRVKHAPARLDNGLHVRTFEQNRLVPSAGHAKLVWPGLVLAGLALGAVVLASWPEPTTRLVRLPYGESAPKTPQVVRAQPVVGAASADAAAAPVDAVTPDVSMRAEGEDAARVLAAVEPDPSRAAGPRPIRSQLELQPGYVRESPEALGAEPLPGAVLTPPAPPVAR